MRICSHAKSISFADAAQYFYLQRGDSATGSFTARRSFGELVSLGEQVDALRDCESQDESRTYIRDQIRTYMRRFFLALSQGGAYEEDARAFCDRLAAIVCGISDYEEFYADLPELKVLVEERVFLPPPPHSTRDVRMAAIARRTDYMSKLTSVPEKELVDDYANALLTVFSRESSGARLYVKSFLFTYKQLSTLEKPLRRMATKRVVQLLGNRLKRRGWK